MLVVCPLAAEIPIEAAGPRLWCCGSLVNVIPQVRWVKNQRNQWDSSSELSSMCLPKNGVYHGIPSIFFASHWGSRWIESASNFGVHDFQILEDGWMDGNIGRSEPCLSFEPRQTGLLWPRFLGFLQIMGKWGNGWFAPLSLAFSLKPIFTGLWVDEQHPGIKPSQMQRFLMFSGYIRKFSCWVVSRITRDFCGDSNTKTGDSTATMGHAASWCQLIHMSQPRTSVVWIEPET